ncbi:ligand-binding sensor domain-containing protein [Spirosoma flavum]|uniref:Two-component regulator propeller domain-containing protein n=1 Tax=Spirosoma flavum TaxID=2048557 RepID=A0ABW6AED3_9BACT
MAPPSTQWFQHLTLRQGLAANYAMSITQDKLGFIWVGTVNGLNRFDGLRCLTYTRQTGSAHLLSNRIVRSVFTAKNGTLWVGTQEGLNRFEPDKQTFQQYSLSHLGIGCNLIRNIVEGSYGTLFLATNGGLVLLNPTTGKFSLLTLPADSASRLGANTIRRLLVDGSTLWIATQAGLYAYDQRTKQFQVFHHDETNSASLPNDYVSALAIHPTTRELFIGTNEGHIAKLNPATRAFRQLPLQANHPISSILFTKTHDLWVGVLGGGIQRYDSIRNQFSVYLNDENNPRSLGSNSVRDLFEDQSGVVWAVTDDAGVSWFNPTVEKFHSLFDDVGYRPASSLGLDASRLAIDRQNRLWVATHDGVVWIDPKTQRYHSYRHDPTNPHSLRSNLVHCVLIDQRGQVWFGSAKGLDRFNSSTQQFDQIRCLPTPESPTQYPEFDSTKHLFVAGNQVFNLAQGANGRIFVGTDEKLTIYDPNRHTFRNQFNDERIRRLPGKNYNTLYVDRQNNLWVGGLGPVYKISSDLRLVAQYVHKEDDRYSLPDDGVTDFAEDASGRMWLGTDNGLARLDQKTGRFTVYTTQHGLPNNDIAALLMAGDSLWVTTSRGLACVDTRQLKFTVFDEADGSPASEFESGSAKQDSAGRLYFGAMRGLVYVQPDRIRLNRFVPPVYLTSLRSTDQEFLQGSQTTPQTVVLNYTQNAFSFDMASLNFDHPEGNQYAYQLEGFEDHWNSAGNRPFGSYTNVPPGDYVLHVIAANNDGVWNRRGYRLPLHLKPPFWQTWWFRIGSLTTLITLILVVAKRRDETIQQEHRDKSEFRERLAASELKALRSQMNPHFLFNSLNAIRLFVLQNDSDNADKYLVKFARLMRLILDNSGQEWVTLASELDQLTLYLELEQLRFNSKFDFSIVIDPILQQERTKIPPMIIQPYIENAILHGMAHKKTPGTILISLKPVNQYLECVVEDDGIGRQKAIELKSKTVASHKSVGLKVTEDRLQLMSQRSGQEARVDVIDKVNEANEPMGTKVIIQLPLITY